MMTNKEYGETCENEFIDLYNTNLIFNEYRIYKTRDEYCEVDFFNKDGFVFELKSLRNSYETYPNVVLDFEKIKIKYNYVLIYRFEPDGDYYFIQYDKNKFASYPKRVITPYGKLPRMTYFIDRNDLIKINWNSKYALKRDISTYDINIILGNKKILY